MRWRNLTAIDLFEVHVCPCLSVMNVSVSQGYQERRETLVPKDSQDQQDNLERMVSMVT